MVPAPAGVPHEKTIHVFLHIQYMWDSSVYFLTGFFNIIQM